VTHSHLPARHLIKQIECDRANRTKRDIRPAWLTALIEFAAELFEPLSDVGRVGFDCRLDENGWTAALYLGAVELLGGKDDGQTRQLDFRFDLQPLLERFTRVEDVSWTVFPQGDRAAGDKPHSLIAIDGSIGTDRLRVEVHSSAPAAAGPGLRRLPDGRFEPV